MSAPKVKVCGMMSAEAVSELSALPIDYFGAIFVPHSKRCVDDSFLSELNSELPLVGVFYNHEIDEIVRVFDKRKLSAIQLHGDESPEYVDDLRMRLPDTDVWKVLHVGEEFPTEKAAEYGDDVDLFLFDTESPEGGGSGKHFDWGLLSNYQEETPYVLSGGIAPDDAASILELQSQDSRLYGVDINSRFEKETGRKDAEQIKKFLKEIGK